MEYFVEYCVQPDLGSIYKKEKEVGKGNYAKVWMGKEIQTGEVVAIKSIHKSIVRKSERGIEVVVNEINIMRVLRHPYICSLFGVYED